MRNGDAYKIRRLVETGTPKSDVIKMFGRYPPEEVERYFPVEEVKASSPEVVDEQPRQRRRRSA